MNSSVRKVALGLGLVFVALLVNLNYVQLGRSQDLSNNPLNQRKLLASRGIKRGEILAADGSVLAESLTTGDDVDRYRRRYPLGDLMGYLTGYYTSDIFCGADGVEQTFSDQLNGIEPMTSQSFWDQALGRQRDGNVLQLTIRPDLQRLAREKLGRQRGAVAAIDPRTGAILALWATPSYDPNKITHGIGSDCVAPKRALENEPLHPLRDRAVQERYPPGSTFKIVTAAAGLASGMSPSTSFPNPHSLNLPDTDKNLNNFGGGSCPGGGSISMAAGLRVSCNTTFAQVAMRVGASKLDAMAHKFGLDTDPQFDVPAVPSCLVAIPGFGCGPADLSRPATAYSGIGQQDVRVTPLQMARIAATVQNLGRVPRPYLVQKVQDPDGKLLSQTKPELSAPIYSTRVANELRNMLYDVVRFGTGAVVGFNLRLGKIGGKTGTAQTGVPGQAPHVWFVAFAPTIAVAVVVENGGNLAHEATGGRVAGPIAKAIVEKVLRDQRNR